VGMMEGAFFVSRTDLIAWVNSSLSLNLAKVEQCASGAVYCQIIDMCHPGTVAMKKVNWMAKAEHEYIPNYKVLQAAFDRNAIEKHIDVDKLIRAKYQDNLEFLQWMKCYAEREAGCNTGYDPLPLREGRPMPAWAKAQGIAAKVAAGVHKENLRPAPAGIKVRPPGPQAPKAVPVRSSTPLAPSRTPRSATNCAPANSSDMGEAPAAARAAAKRNAELATKLAERDEDVVELTSTLEGMEKERDYYFRKLREVEILCETLQAQPDSMTTAEKLIADIQSILYAEEPEEEQEEEGEGLNVV